MPVFPQKLQPKSNIDRLDALGSLEAGIVHQRRDIVLLHRLVVERPQQPLEIGRFAFGREPVAVVGRMNDHRHAVVHALGQAIGRRGDDSERVQRLGLRLAKAEPRQLRLVSLLRRRPSLRTKQKFDRMTRRLNIGSYANVCMRLILLTSVLLVISATGYLT